MKNLKIKFVEMKKNYKWFGYCNDKNTRLDFLGNENPINHTLIIPFVTIEWETFVK